MGGWVWEGSGLGGTDFGGSGLVVTSSELEGLAGLFTGNGVADGAGLVADGTGLAADGTGTVAAGRVNVRLVTGCAVVFADGTVPWSWAVKVMRTGPDPVWIVVPAPVPPVVVMGLLGVVGAVGDG